MNIVQQYTSEIALNKMKRKEQ